MLAGLIWNVVGSDAVPIFAVIVACTTALTGTVFTTNFKVDAPAGTVTLIGMVASGEFEIK